MSSPHHGALLIWGSSALCRYYKGPPVLFSTELPDIAILQKTTSAAISCGMPPPAPQTEIYLILRLATLTNSFIDSLLGGWTPPDWQRCLPGWSATTASGAVTVIDGERGPLGSFWLEEDQVLEVCPELRSLGVIWRVDIWFPGSSLPPKRRIFWVRWSK